jgi:hypothetical protein
LPFSETSSTKGAEMAANPEKSGMSIATARPGSTRMVRFADTPLTPVRVTTWRPALRVSSVSGVSPAGLPSIATWAPAGCVVTVRRPLRPTGGAATSGAGAGGAAVVLAAWVIDVSDGVNPTLIATATAISTTPAPISFHGRGGGALYVPKGS